MLKMHDTVVAYMDICGFSDLVKRDVNKAAEMLEYIRKMMDSACKLDIKGSTPFEWNQFSDSIFFYWKTRDDGLDLPLLILFLKIVATVQYEAFVRFGLPVRGAISRGQIYTSRTAVGMAVLNSYKMESETADWFRVLVDESVLSLLPNCMRDVYIHQYDKNHTLNFLYATSLNRVDMELRDILSSFRDRIVADVYDESTRSFKLRTYDESSSQYVPFKPEETGTVAQFCKASLLENRYGMLILYYNNVCFDNNLRELHLDARPIHGATVTTIRRIQELQQEYPENDKVLRFNIDGLLRYFKNRKRDDSQSIDISNECSIESDEGDGCIR